MADSELTILLKMVDKASGPMGKVGKSLRSIGKSATVAGKSLTKNLTFPILALGAASFKVFSDFETGMSSVSTLVDTTTESMKDMGKEVQDIAKRSPVALGELTSALFDIRSASIPAANAMNVLERSAQLGVAGLGSTAQAARLAAGAINAWGLEGAAADKIFNTIFQTTKNGITTIAGLEQGFGQVAGKMASAGIEVDDYFASIAALTTTTLKAAGAHTQMRAAVDGLERSGKKTRKIFRKLGVEDFKELVKTSGGVTEAFRLIAGAAGKQSGALQALIGSSEGAAAVTALIGSQGDKQLATLKDMRKETKGLADVQVAANKQFATSASKIKIMKNNLVVAGIKIGSILAPAILKLTEKLSEAVAWFDNLDDSTKDTIVRVAGIVAVVGPVLIVFGKLTTALGFLAPAFGLVGTALGILSKVILANPILALIAAIALSALAIHENWEDIEAFFKLVWDGVKGLFDDALNHIVGVVEDVVGQLDKLGDAVVANEGLFGFAADVAGVGAAGDFIIKQQKGKIQKRRDFATESEASLSRVQENRQQAQREFFASQKLENEITIKIEDGKATVKEVKGPGKIDVKTGFQGTF